MGKVVMGVIRFWVKVTVVDDRWVGGKVEEGV